jgi:hypothetical protein
VKVMSRQQKLTSKRKEAEVGSPQQPQDLIDKAAQPERLVEGKSISGEAKLQEKMIAAAKEFATLEQSNRGGTYQPEYRDQPFEFFVLEMFLPHVHCTPEAAFFRLGNEWIRLTEEALGEAMESEENARWWLTELRKAAKKYGKINWTLPRLKGSAQ